MNPPVSSEEELISRVESADADQFAEILSRPTPEQDRVLRVYFGEAKYAELRRLAAQQGYGPASARGLFGGLFGGDDEPAGEPMGNVVVLPGLLGSELTVYEGDDGDRVWVHYWRLLRGRIEELRLGPDGSRPHDPRLAVRPTGVLKDYYGEQILSLRRNWNVEVHPYDWRKSLNESADGLARLIRRKFGAGTPVHLVAHSMGGLLARLFIRRHPELWQDMADGESSDRSRGGRLVMLGTPNYGSHLAVQALTGLAGTVRKLELLDTRHDLDEILRILSSFPGFYQLLPSEAKAGAGASRLYEADTYRRANPYVSQSLLDAAGELHRELSEIVDPDRMVYVAGYDQPTVSDIDDYDRLDDAASYEATVRGDGTVSHKLGLLTGVKTYYVDEVHEDLPDSRRVRDAMDDLLLAGKTTRLDGRADARRGPAREPGLALEIQRQRERDVGRLREMLSRERAAMPAAASAAAGPVSATRREAERLLLRDVRGDEPAAVASASPAEAADAPARPRVEIVVRHGQIQRPEDLESADAIAVGHYLGVQPTGSELALDLAISGVEDPRASAERLTLTPYAARGTLRGELGQSFFLPDPRQADRLIAVAGMGPPGRCGLPELTVIARELCWALGRAGKVHLATVLIGSGSGNLAIREAIDAWLDGLGQAFTDAPDDNRLSRITFVEDDPGRVIEIATALREAHRRGMGGIEFEPPPDDAQLRRRLIRADEEFRRDRMGEEATPPDEGAPVRLTVGVDLDPADTFGGTYTFSLLTRTASVPTRSIPVDLRMVKEANDELAGASDPDLQVSLGRYLDELLIPDDLRGPLVAPAPLVIQLDSTTARIHWELLAQPNPAYLAAGGGNHAEAGFLGLTRGLTRQLRAGFAPPPEPPPPAARTLRVLIVADPAPDLPLAGAEQEGFRLAELFEAYNRVGRGPDGQNRVEVTALTGPSRATRTTVHRELLLNRYDVFHFAGHCFFDKERPERSGLIFSRTELLTARELNRIDRVPGLIFCNACESGVTPDRTGARSAEMAPVFAEAFFARGVSNFVCTAWPVGDRAALRFAAVTYSRLLGLRWDDGDADFRPEEPEPMYRAMRAARRSLAGNPRGSATWGAYQHYGSPYFRFFAGGPGPQG